MAAGLHAEEVRNASIRHIACLALLYRGVMKLLRKDKKSGDVIGNYRPLTMLNTDLKVLVKILPACRLSSLV